MPYKTGTWGIQAKERSKKRTKYFIKYRQKDPEKYRARRILEYALFTKKIVKPKKCVRCGGTKPRIEGHHTDYKQPLKVDWLCSSCHRVADKERKG